MRLEGPSPLARGTFIAAACSAFAHGLIPARAGNTRSGGPGESPGRAHPRSHGEHHHHHFSFISSAGSSPLVRGTPDELPVDDRLVGLIPARTGNMLTLTIERVKVWAHPRSHGEHPVPIALGMVKPGSSPLTRGTRHYEVRVFLQPGLIPARAGNIAGNHRYRPIGWAHPRSHGEHSFPLSTSARGLGSSPPVRGTLAVRVRKCDLLGLIPARVGNIPDRKETTCRSRAHPRSRGEHAELLGYASVRSGSSPLPRGTFAFTCIIDVPKGLIPARAGSTQRSSARHARAGAHPRSRGEHPILVVMSSRRAGLSPLARGTYNVVARELHNRGLIPARTGNMLRTPPLSLQGWAHPRSRGEHR